MTKRLIFILTLFISIHSLAQGIVKGRIINETNEPIASVTIQLNNPTALTDEKGEYSINTKPGSGKLTASAIGFETIQKNINIQEGRPSITLANKN